MTFTEDTPLQALDMRFGGEHLICGGDYFISRAAMTLGELHEANPTWAISDMLRGLNRLEEAPSACYLPLSQNPAPNVVELPAAHRMTDTFAVLLAGGAYGTVCTMVESLPAAVELNALGIDCYCLSYRTATAESFQAGLMPRPLDDLAAALTMIFSRRGRQDPYLVAGFSAGGHVAALWGTGEKGAPKYGLPLPEKLLLGYPLISLNHIPEPMGSFLRRGLLGASATSDDALPYDAAAQMTRSYPPFVLARAADDTTVSKADGDRMAEAARRCGVRFSLITAPAGGHGFGAGSETPLRGWISAAAKSVL